jgi:hypothetical protein
MLLLPFPLGRGRGMGRDKCADVPMCGCSDVPVCGCIKTEIFLFTPFAIWESVTAAYLF